MASAFGHAFAAYALSKGFPSKIQAKKLGILGIALAVLPDADVISFSLGIAYGDFWGHRGFSHSLVFSLFIGIVTTVIFYRKHFWSAQGALLICYFFLATASHAILDAMTSGGLGVAIFSPFENGRHFLPWRPIKVSPIGAARFFSMWGVKVILSELIYIGIPGVLWIVGSKLLRNKRKQRIT